MTNLELFECVLQILRSFSNTIKIETLYKTRYPAK